MSFIAPLFFVALAALAIPVLLHLIQREKKQIMHFPSLMFVRQIPYKSVQRRRIHNWLLLMVRLAALALIVFAFARPLLQRDDLPLAAGTGAREVVILLDTSYSIGYADRWERARAAAYDAVNGLAPGDRASVVLFATGAEIVLRSTGSADRDAINEAIAAAQPTPAATRFAPAIKVAGSLLAESALPRREVILISDFQRGGWRGEEGARLPQGAMLTPVPIGGALDTPNATLTAVSLPRSTFSDQERVTVTAAVVNRTARALNGGQLTLEIGGRTVQSLQLDVEANGSSSVEFAPVTLGGQTLRGTVRAGNDGLAADNAFNFVVSPAQPVRVIVVDPAGAGANSLFVTSALNIGDAPRFDTVVRQPENVSDEDLRGAGVVMLNDVVVPVGLGRRLQRFVEGGGGLMVTLGSRASWPQEADILPATLQEPVDRTRGEAARMGAPQYTHPIFEPFRAPRSGDFGSAPVYWYRSVMPVEGAQVLARFDSGAPALVERKVGTGRVLLWTTTLDQRWSDLPRKAVFLPFMHQVARYLAAYTEPAPWRTVGQVFDASAAQGTDRVLLTPSGRRLPMDEEGAEVMELTEQGFYEVRSQAGDEVMAIVASNVDAAEADLTVMDPKEIAAAAAGGEGGTGVMNAAQARQTPEAQERSQRLWWYVLVAGIVLLGADTFISNRLSKT